MFKGRVIEKDNRALIVIDSPHLFDLAKRKLVGKEIELTIKKLTKKRSMSQNNYYWGCVLKIFGEELGYNLDEMHRICGDKFLQYYEEGRPFPKVQSTTELSTQRFNEYLSQIQIWASSEFNIYIPDPNEWEIIKNITGA